MKKIYTDFIADLIIACVALAIAIIMLPPIGIGEKLLELFVALSIGIFMLPYQIFKMKRNYGKIFIITFVEICITAILMLDLIAGQFDVLNLNFEVCRVLGIAIWIRAFCSLQWRKFNISTIFQASFPFPRRRGLRGNIPRIPAQISSTACLPASSINKRRYYP